MQTTTISSTVIKCISICVLVALISGCVSIRVFRDDGSALDSGILFAGSLSGLEYTQAGIRKLIQNSGKFDYRPAQPVQFFVGDISLGTAVTGQKILTPMDLVRRKGTFEAEHLLNLMSFLLSLDADNSYDNGIQISPSTRASAVGLQLEFLTSAEDFSHQIQEKDVIRKLTVQLPNGPRELVPRAQALKYLEQQLLSRQRALYAELFAQWGPGTCDKDQQCEALPLSYQSCGPSSYLTFSSQDENYWQQRNRIETYYSLDRNRSMLSAEEEQCKQQTKPRPACVETRCRDLTSSF